MTPPLNPAAISVEGLWQVFGERDAPALGAALQGGAAPAEAAAALAGQGLIAAVRDVSFTVTPGELFVIMGLSGSGKSTLIRCISRLIEPTAGAVRIDGEDILAAPPKRMIELRRRKLGMVFQHFGLFPHMTAAENVAFPLKMNGLSRAERRARAVEVLGRVGLSGREGSFPRELSGGQKQRVGIARSLAANPDIWFLDEPFSALDPLIRRQLQDEFLALQQDLNKTIAFITHDIGEALKLADRIAIMRDGAVVQIGTPSEIVMTPADGYVREFTRDIPKTRHMTLADVMTPLDASTGPPAGGPAGGPALSTAMTLEDALGACARSLKPMSVRDGDGRIVGLVRPEALARALGDLAPPPEPIPSPEPPSAVPADPPL